MTSKWQTLAAVLGLAAGLSGCMSAIPALAPKAKNVEPNISAAFPYERKTVDVLDSTMSYVEVGEGKPILLVHGNPTSSYLWRNVIPGLQGQGRVIAVDLIGMGQSGKPDLDYTFEDHLRYFDAFVEALDLTDVTLVLHDWGGGIGLDYAARHPDNVRAIAMMEAVTAPFSWKNLSPPEKYLFKSMRKQKKGDHLMLDQNYFVEKLVPAFSARKLTDEEMAAYREPYKTRADRKPTRRWPQEVPFDGDPPGNAKRIGDNYEALKASSTPVLFLYAKPGALYNEAFVARLRKDVPRATFVSIGSGLHYIQEVQPTAISTAVREWMQTLPAEPADSASAD